MERIYRVPAIPHLLSAFSSIIVSIVFLNYFLNVFLWFIVVKLGLLALSNVRTIMLVYITNYIGALRTLRSSFSSW